MTYNDFYKDPLYLGFPEVWLIWHALELSWKHMHTCQPVLAQVWIS